MQLRSSLITLLTEEALNVKAKRQTLVYCKYSKMFHRELPTPCSNLSALTVRIIKFNLYFYSEYYKTDQILINSEAEV